jgi:hypothetical protein
METGKKNPFEMENAFPRISLTTRLQATHLLTTNQIKSVVRHLPKDMDQLNLTLPDFNANENEKLKVLEITRAHERDQDQFVECIQTLKAYAKGGNYGMDLLNKLHNVVINHYCMQDEKWEVLMCAGVSMNFETGELVRSKGN